MSSDFTASKARQIANEINVLQSIQTTNWVSSWVEKALTYIENEAKKGHTECFFYMDNVPYNRGRIDPELFDHTRYEMTKRGFTVTFDIPKKLAQIWW